MTETCICKDECKLESQRDERSKLPEFYTMRTLKD